MKVIKIQKLISIFLLFGLLPLFNNCSKIESLSHLALLSGFEKTTDNGIPYDGKQTRYYRYIPNFNCGGTEKSVQSLLMSAEQTFVTGSANETCNSLQHSITPTEVDISPFQQEFVIFKDRLFKFYETEPVGIPINLAELLCRDSTDKPNFEIVAHYDREKNSAQLRVYATGIAQSEFATSRILSSTGVQYVSDQLTLTVDFPLMGAKNSSGKLSGQIVAVQLNSIPSLQSATSITCVVGGALDTSFWNYQTLSSTDSRGLHLFENGDLFLFASIYKQPGFELSPLAMQIHSYKVQSNGKYSFENLSTQRFGSFSNLDYAIPVGAPNKLIVRTNHSSDHYELSSDYLYDAINGDFTQITNLNLPNPMTAAPPKNMKNEFVSSALRPQVTTNNHLLMQIQEPYSTPPQMIFRDVDLSGGQNVDLALNTLALPIPNSAQVVLITSPIQHGQINYDVYNSINQTTLHFATDGVNCKANIVENLILGIDSNTLVLGLRCQTENKAYLVFIDLKTHQLQKVIENRGLLWVSKNKNWIVIGDFQNLTETTTGKLQFQVSPVHVSAYQISSDRTVAVDIDPRQGYYEWQSETEFKYATGYTSFDAPQKVALLGEQLFGLKNTNGTVDLVRIHLQTRKTDVICKEVLGKKTFVNTFENENDGTETAFLFTYDEKIKIFRFFRINENATCDRLNEFPSAYSGVAHVEAAKTGFSVLLYHGNSNLNISEAVFVPINGQPPLKLSKTNQGSWQMVTDYNRDRIFLLGDDTDGKRKLFMFTSSPL